MRRLIFAAPLLALFALAAMFLGWSLRRDPQVAPDALVGRPLPALTLARLGGGTPVVLRDAVAAAGGRVVLVNVWASWCAPCRVEAPVLEALQARGVPLLGVAYKDKPEAAAGFLAQVGDPFGAVALDPDGRAGLELGVSGVPETFAVGPDGVILAKHAGALTEADARRLLTARR